MMRNCEEATRLCSDEMDRRLTFRERLALRLHVLLCDGCSNFRNQMSLLRLATRRLGDGKADLNGRAGEIPGGPDGRGSP